MMVRLCWTTQFTHRAESIEFSHVSHVPFFQFLFRVCDSVTTGLLLDPEVARFFSITHKVGLGQAMKC